MLAKIALSAPSRRWSTPRTKVACSHTETPLQLKLESLAESIGKFGLGFAVITFLALMIRLVIDVSVRGNGWDKNRHPAAIVQAIIIAVVPLL